MNVKCKDYYQMMIISDMEGNNAGNKSGHFKGFFKPKQIVTEKEKNTAMERKEEEARSNTKGFFKTVANEETAGAAMLGLFLYSMLIFFLPLGVYFLSKEVLENYHYSDTVTTIAPAILAIASVNLVIVAYVIKAFREESKIKEKSS